MNSKICYYCEYKYDNGGSPFVTCPSCGAPSE